MIDGPWLPWATAQLLYDAYERLYGSGQSMTRLAERGGFTWEEITDIFKALHKRDRALWTKLMEASGRPNIDIRKEERAR